MSVVFCEKIQKYSFTKMDVMGKKDFANFQFKMNFGRIVYIVTGIRIVIVLTNMGSINYGNKHHFVGHLYVALIWSFIKSQYITDTTIYHWHI